MNRSTAAPLLFNWGAPRRRSRALIAFLIASIGAHAAGFYIFQVVYPPTVSLTPPPQRVNLISAKTERGATILQWVDAEDPALVSTTRKPSDARRYLFGKTQHVPSYFASEPTLRAAPPLHLDLHVPSAQPPASVPATPRARAAPIGIAPTKVTFSNEFERLGPPKFVTANFKASTKEPPQNAQFRIAVDRPGAVRYCFILNSSGDAALNEQARAYLALCRFPARAEGSTSDDESLVCGIATIEWGNDLGPANSKSKPSAP
jgi:hypothetical protein